MRPSAPTRYRSANSQVARRPVGSSPRNLPVCSLCAAADGEGVPILNVVVLLRAQVGKGSPDTSGEVRGRDVQPACPAGQADAGLHEVLVGDVGQMGEVAREEQ